MRDILPPQLVDLLRDRYLAGVADAEAAFDQHQADEDALTGGLGQALSMRAPIVFSDHSAKYYVSVNYKKLRGRGKGAPEKKLGADGVFQISVTDNHGNVIRRKGLPFQAKTNWLGTNKSLYDQASLMEKQTPGGLVIDYSENGYKACSAEAVILANGKRADADNNEAMNPLGQVLSRDFLECTIGTIGLYFDPKLESYAYDLALITTDITKVDLDEV